MRRPRLVCETRSSVRTSETAVRPRQSLSVHARHQLHLRTPAAARPSVGSAGRPPPLTAVGKSNIGARTCSASHGSTGVAWPRTAKSIRPPGRTVRNARPRTKGNTWDGEHALRKRKKWMCWWILMKKKTRLRGREPPRAAPPTRPHPSGPSWPRRRRRSELRVSLLPLRQRSNAPSTRSPGPRPAVTDHARGVVEARRSMSRLDEPLTWERCL